MRTRITITLTWYLLTGILLIALIGIGTLSWSVYKLHTRILNTEKTQQQLVEQQEKDNRQKEEEATRLLMAQQAELKQTKEALEQTKKENVKTSAQLQSLAQAVEEQTHVEKEIVISSNDVTPYVTGVVQVICSTRSGISSGSGSLFYLKEIGQVVLTNHHVVSDASKCTVVMTNTANTPVGIFALEGSIYTYNENTDEAILTVGKSLSSSNVPAQNYNYSLSTIRRCSSLMPVGTPVVIVGFPAYAKRDTSISIEGIGTVNSIYRTTTNGIVSGYDTSKGGEANYFVSAKIDNGNSGGAALAKDNKGICILGLPTWLSVGNYETQGLVQNIVNLLPTN